MEEPKDTCLICRDSLGTNDVVNVRRGLNTIREASRLLNDGLAGQLEKATVIKLHNKCRRDYTRRPSAVEEGKASNCTEDPFLADETRTPSLRSSSLSLDFETSCIFCGNDASTKVPSRQPTKYRKVVHEVMSPDILENIKKQAIKRDDDFGWTVLTRVNSGVDLAAVNAKYHHNCHLEFFRDKSQQQGPNRGRPDDPVRQEAFAKLCDFLDTNNQCQHSLTELNNQMSVYLEGDQGYSSTWLKEKLLRHYGEEITFTNICGQSCVVSFKDAAQRILNDKWYSERHRNMKDERKRIVDTAAAIIREDISSQVYDCNVYPSFHTIDNEENMVPETLKCFIEGLIESKNADSKVTKRKCCAIEEAIISATRPRSFISPILLSVAIYIHRKCGSRQVIDVLNSLGFSSNYVEVQRYESSILLHEPQEEVIQGFTQFVFDNADFNVDTLDGHNTFHSLGGIKCVTPPNVMEATAPLPRLNHIPEVNVIGSFGKVPIKTYRRPSKAGLQKILIKEITYLKPSNLNTAAILDSVWILGKHLGVSPRPSWNGYMQVVMQGSKDYEVSEVQALPFINMDPTNLSTLYTALEFAEKECRQNGQKTCLVTFDQPLYVKACDIVAATEDLNVVVRLGGFHLLMSFMGAVGHIMSGSGLEELWSTVYASNSVTHMMSGHAYSRALCAHFLTQEAIAMILLERCANLDDDIKESVRQIYQELLNHVIDPHEAVEQETAKELHQLLEQLSKPGPTTPRTAKLWLQYFNEVNLMRMFLRAERLGDWELHLYCVQKMLPHLHAAGHLAYARCAHLYVQQMRELPQKMTNDEHQKLTNQGFFTIRRTDKLWGGIWSDMTIEQVLMRSMKSSGGLTHGRGITESTLAKWVLVTPSCVKVCNSLEEFCGKACSSSEQHVEMRDSRQVKDEKDLTVFLQWLQIHSPFAEECKEGLVSLGSGLVADTSVNCNDAVAIGSSSMAKMMGKNFAEVKLSRKDKVQPLSAMKNTIKVRNENVVINPSQLFNRILCILKASSDLEEYLHFELSQHPPSLFNDSYMRRSAKCVLANLLHTFVQDEDTVPVRSKFVVDGGYLLHSVVWPNPGTYQEVCEAYANYVETKYSRNASVIFDGYDGPPTPKSTEQRRRASRACSPNIIFEGNMHTTTCQGDFLGNGHNKSRLITLLSAELEKRQMKVYQAEADADVLIVSTALNFAEDGFPTVVVGNDTDLLVMLIGRARSTDNIYMLHPGKGKAPAKLYNIYKVQQQLGHATCHNLLFMHAVTGCDTTSAPFGKGKKQALKILQENKEVSEEIEVFNKVEASHEEIGKAGETFLLALYRGGKCKTLDELRYIKYKQAIGRQSLKRSFDIATLPPTSASCSQHSYRAYLQVQSWLGRDLNPTDWGWKFCNELLLPVETDLAAAPEKILNMISCKCKKGCKQRCGCRKLGVPCSAMCTECAGVDCMNTEKQVDD